MPFYSAYIRFGANDELACIKESLPPYFPVKAYDKILHEIDELVLISENSNPLLLNSKFLYILNLIISETKRPDSLIDKNYEIIKNAKRLLWNTKISAKEVAEKSGFGCQQYLNKIFKKETGLTPGEYRRLSHLKYLS